jgi:hypothetical protein
MEDLTLSSTSGTSDVEMIEISEVDTFYESLTKPKSSLPAVIRFNKKDFKKKPLPASYQVVVERYQYKSDALFVDSTTGRVRFFPKTPAYSQIDAGVDLLKGLISGEFGDDYDSETLRHLMMPFSECKQAIWGRLTSEEKSFLSKIKKPSIRVEKDTLIIESDLLNVLTPINTDDDLELIKQVTYKDQEYFLTKKLGNIYDFVNKEQTNTLLVDVKFNRACITEYIAPPMKKQQVKQTKSERKTTPKKQTKEPAPKKEPIKIKQAELFTQSILDGSYQSSIEV